MNYKIISLLTIILTFTTLIILENKFKGLDYFNFNKNKARISFVNFNFKELKELNPKLTLYSLDTISVAINSIDFELNGFPDFYGKDYMSIKLGNNEKELKLNGYKFKSYFKLNSSIKVEKIDQNLVEVNWDMSVGVVGTVGVDTILINPNPPNSMPPTNISK